MTNPVKKRQKKKRQQQGRAERSQGIYASEASRPLTLEAMFGRVREEETNTPESLEKAAEATKMENAVTWNIAEERNST